VTPPTKLCPKCRKDKPLSAFARRPGRKGKVRSRCKDCTAEDRRRIMANAPKCSDVDCKKNAAVGGLCWAHYARERRGAASNAPIRGSMPRLERAWRELTDAALAYADAAPDAIGDAEIALGTAARRFNSAASHAPRKSGGDDVREANAA
jgi:hypothetical protein